MRRTRRPDGKFGCGHCVKCNYGRPDRCDQPVELVVAKSIADATFGAAIAKAEADAAKMQHVVYLEERRREQVF